MRKFRFLVLLGVILACALPSFAGPVIQISIDEFGNGTLAFPFAPAFPLASGLFDDPGPGGQSNVLTYSLGGAPTVITGDVFLMDANNTISDVIRFNIGPPFDTEIAFYSESSGGVDSVADGAPFPTLFYGNTISIPENTAYMPLDGQPGFVPGFDVDYSFVSDVPEPGTLVLLGAGLAVLIYRRR